MSLAHRYNKHIVYASFTTINRIIKSEYLAKSVRRIYSDIKKNISANGSLFNKIAHKVQVTFTPKTTVDEKLLVISPSLYPSFEFYEETHLLTENLSDSKFFVYLANYYKRLNNIKCDFMFYPLQGGGTTIQDVFKHEISLSQHFCLTIMDSDMGRPNGAKGSTCRNVLKANKKNTLSNCLLYVMTNVREIENLIPYHLISIQEKYKNCETLHFLQNIDSSYFDMKEGLLPYKLKDTDFYNYWKNEFSFNDKLIEKIDYCRGCIQEFNVSKEYCQKTCGEKIIIGFGKQLLESTLKDNITKVEMNNISSVHLSDAQKQEWYNIGQLVFDWCCVPKRHIMIY